MKIAEPILDNYKHYPELFIVASDFRTKNGGQLFSINL